MRRRRNERAVDIAAWWEGLRSTAPPQLRGLWFGIVELARPMVGWHLYVAGTETFDPEDATAEWAAADYLWWPEGRYFAVPELATLPYGEMLARAVDLVRSIEPWREVPAIGVAVGFDDGDFQIVYRADA